MSDFLSEQELAGALGVSLEEAVSLADEGAIRAYAIGHSRRFYRKDVEALLAQRRQEEAAASSTAVYYQSTGRGRANPDGRPGVVYFGKTYRIPRRDAGDGYAQRKWEVDPADFAKPLQLPGSGTRYAPVPDATFERFEVFDAVTGDLLVMWRIPFEESPPEKRHSP